MENPSNGNRRQGVGGGLSRSAFGDDLFAAMDHHPFRSFVDPSSQPRRGIPRTFTERSGRFFEDDPNNMDDMDRFFDGFQNGGDSGAMQGAAGRRPFHDEPAFFRSSLPRRPPPFQQQPNGSRQIPVQRQQTTPQPERREFGHSSPFSNQHHQRSKSHYDNSNNNDNMGGAYFPDWDNADGSNNFYSPQGRHFDNRQFSPSAHHPQNQHQGGGAHHHHPIDPTASQPAPPSVTVVHQIPIRHEKPRKQQFVEINNARPNYSNGALNPDNRRHRHPGMQNNERSQSIPNIVIDDYGDGKSPASPAVNTANDDEQRNNAPLPTVIPLPAPAIPLPAPDGMKIATEVVAKRKKEEGDEEGESNAQEEKAEKSVIDEEAENGGKIVREKAAKNTGQMGEKEEKGAVNTHICEEEMTQNMDQTRGEQTGQGHQPNKEARSEHLIRLLDETEQRVEMLREAAARLEHEKETIMDTLGTIIHMTDGSGGGGQSHWDELGLNADRILARCRAVNVNVHTPRDEHQQRALQQVEQVIQHVVDRMQEDLAHAKARIRGFLAACMPDESGHIDEKFQSLIIACAADDQKKIRRRLAQLIDKIERAQQMTPSR